MATSTTFELLDMNKTFKKINKDLSEVMIALKHTANQQKHLTDYNKLLVIPWI